ncbi:MAG: hypothetical protein U0Q16_14035 [Bryobacteraceae bacterium]
MSRLFAAAACLTAFSLNAAVVPRPSPDFKIDIPGGQPVSLSQYKGKTIILAFMMFT